MTLSRCGRQYPTLLDATRAAEQRAYKTGIRHWAKDCYGEHWHVVSKLGAEPKLDPFPPAIRSMLVKRDECCQRCGFTGRLEAHHRRAKASGGSKARSHTQCACNGVLLCRRCHEWAHLNPRKARAEGWIVLQSVSLPGSMPVELGIKVWLGANWLYPTCDGRWNVNAQ